MIDEELIYDLKTLMKTYKDKLIFNLDGNEKINVQYIVTVAILDSLIYCIEKDKLNEFETILQYNIYKFGGNTNA